MGRADRQTGPLARALAPALFAAAAVVMPAPMLAQSLPVDLPAKSELSPADAAAIASFAEQQIARLRDPDPAMAQKARKALVDPVLGESVTVPFRLEYAKALTARLTELTKGQDPMLAATALRVAGVIATATTERVLQEGLKSAVPATRFAAAVGYQELLRAVSLGSNSLGDSAVDTVLMTVKNSLEREADPKVAEGLVLSLRATAAAERAGNATLRIKSTQSLCDAGAAVLKRLRTTPPAGTSTGEWASPVYQALDGAYQTMLQLQAGGTPITTPFAKSAGVFAGFALAHARDRLATLDPTSAASKPELDALTLIVGVSENVIVLSDQQANPGNKATAKELRKSFEQAAQRNDATWFDDAAAAYIGANGLLTRPPYGQNAADLAPKK